jgi:CheY-like chemotaxis protein
MMMPVMGGASLIRVLRRINPKIKIAGASGLALDRPGIRALDPTVKHLLHKPYDAETLLATLRTMLDEA